MSYKDKKRLDREESSQSAPPKRRRRSSLSKSGSLTSLEKRETSLIGLECDDLSESGGPLSRSESAYLKGNRTSSRRNGAGSAVSLRKHALGLNRSRSVVRFLDQDSDSEFSDSFDEDLPPFFQEEDGRVIWQQVLVDCSRALTEDEEKLLKEAVFLEIETFKKGKISPSRNRNQNIFYHVEDICAALSQEREKGDFNEKVRELLQSDVVSDFDRAFAAIDNLSKIKVSIDKLDENLSGVLEDILIVTDEDVINGIHRNLFLILQRELLCMQLSLIVEDAIHVADSLELLEQLRGQKLRRSKTSMVFQATGARKLKIWEILGDIPRGKEILEDIGKGDLSPLAQSNLILASFDAILGQMERKRVEVRRLQGGEKVEVLGEEFQDLISVVGLIPFEYDSLTLNDQASCLYQDVNLKLLGFFSEQDFFSEIFDILYQKTLEVTQPFLTINFLGSVVSHFVSRSRQIDIYSDMDSKKIVGSGRVLELPDKGYFLKIFQAWFEQEFGSASEAQNFLLGLLSFNQPTIGIVSRVYLDSVTDSTIQQAAKIFPLKSFLAKNHQIEMFTSPMDDHLLSNMMLDFLSSRNVFECVLDIVRSNPHEEGFYTLDAQLEDSVGRFIDEFKTDGDEGAYLIDFLKQLADQGVIALTPKFLFEHIKVFHKLFDSVFDKASKAGRYLGVLDKFSSEFKTSQTFNELLLIDHLEEAYDFVKKYPEGSLDVSLAQLQYVLKSSSPRKTLKRSFVLNQQLRELGVVDLNQFVHAENYHLTSSLISALDNIIDRIPTELMTLALIERVVFSKRPGAIVNLWLENLELVEQLVSGDINDQQRNTMLGLILEAEHPRNLKKALKYLLDRDEPVGLEILEEILSSSWPARKVLLHCSDEKISDISIRSFSVESQSIDSESEAILFLLKAADISEEDELKDKFNDKSLFEAVYPAVTEFYNKNENDSQFCHGIGKFFRLISSNELSMNLNTSFLRQLSAFELNTDFGFFIDEFGSMDLGLQGMIQTLLLLKQQSSFMQIMPSTIRYLLKNKNPVVFLDVLKTYQTAKYSVIKERWEGILMVGALLDTDSFVEMNTAIQMVLKSRRYDKLTRLLRFLSRYPDFSFNITSFKKLSKIKKIQELTQSLELLKQTADSLTADQVNALLEGAPSPAKVLRVNRCFGSYRAIFDDQEGYDSDKESIVLDKIIEDQKPLSLEKRLKQVRGAKENEHVSFGADEVSVLFEKRSDDLSVQLGQLFRQKRLEEHGQKGLFGQTKLGKLLTVAMAALGGVLTGGISFFFKNHKAIMKGIQEEIAVVSDEDGDGIEMEKRDHQEGVSMGRIRANSLMIG